MSVYQTCEQLEHNTLLDGALCKQLGKTLRQMASQQQLAPILVVGMTSQEATHLAHQLHRTATLLLDLQGDCVEREATLWLAPKKRTKLFDGTEGTLHVTGWDTLRPLECKRLLVALEKFHKEHPRVLLLASLQPGKATQESWTQLSTYFQHQHKARPLYERSQDIDPLLYHLTQTLLKEKGVEELEGFSLEAMAHIHRAILQTQRTTEQVIEFLQTTFQRVQEGRFPLYENYLVAWPTARLLEDLWGYNLQGHDVSHAMQQYNLQDRLFSASLEHSSAQSGFSRELLERQCELLQALIEELPPHQRNYQGMTARLDQLTWLGMKLISSARTQAELRDYFGFGSKGKIPKATAKLKFDQHQLEQHGLRPSDPIPWPQTPLPATPPPQAPAKTNPPVRHIFEITGETDETLFWRHQDLLTVLASDPMDLSQIATRMGLSCDAILPELQKLEARGLLLRQDALYRLPADDVYFKHTNSQLRFMEDNLLHYLAAAFQGGKHSILENVFLRLPEEGLQVVRENLFDPFVHEQLLPLSDPDTSTGDIEPNEKQMYALLLIGTHRLSPQVHGRLPVQERITHYFREACLQRVDRTQKHQAICLQATLMLSPKQAQIGLQHVQHLSKELKQYFPQGRGNKPNFNQTVCFTKVPLQFCRDLPGLGK